MSKRYSRQANSITLMNVSTSGSSTYRGVNMNTHVTTIIEQPLPLAFETPTVDRMMATFYNQWTMTADLCIKRAEELEDTAKELRHRAQELYNARDLTESVKETVIYEIQSRNRANSLALVNPKKDD